LSGDAASSDVLKPIRAAPAAALASGSIIERSNRCGLAKIARRLSPGRRGGARIYASNIAQASPEAETTTLFRPSCADTGLSIWSLGLRCLDIRIPDSRAQDARAAQTRGLSAEVSMKVDFHTHHYPLAYLDEIERHPSPACSVTRDASGQRLVHYARDLNILAPGHLDLGARLLEMAHTGVD